MNQKRMTAREKLQQWFDDKDTPSDAWKTWTLRDIAEDAEVSIYTVTTNLPKMVIGKVPNVDNAAIFNRAREAWRKKYHVGRRNVPLSKEEIEDIRKRRKNGDTLAVIAIDTGHSFSSVQRYCKGIKRGKDVL